MSADSAESRPGWPTLRQWAWTFVPFGLGLTAALWAAELTPNLRLYRSIHTVWLALAFSLVALSLFVHRDRSAGLFNLWRLTWTFGFLAYAVHFAYSWYGVFGDQLATANTYPTLYHVGSDPTVLDLVLVQQGRLVAYSNLGVTALWALDVLLAWVVPGSRRGVLGGLLGLERLTVWAWVLGSVVAATIVFPKHLTSQVLGGATVAAVALSILARLAFGRISSEAAPR